MTNKVPEMYMKEEPDRCRSLVCDPSGIIVAEMVYRCMICFCVSDTMKDARLHYQIKHMDEENSKNMRAENGDDEPPYTNNNQVLNSNSSPMSSIPQLTGPYANSFEHEDSFSPDESENFERYSPLVTMSEGVEPMNGNVVGPATGPGSGGTGGKSGYVNCAVCGVTRFYSCVQRRYGQFTCVTCYRYFRTFLLKPKKFSCPTLGQCQLNVRTRCRACWLSACIAVFSVDLRRQQVIDAFRPFRKAAIVQGAKLGLLSPIEKSEVMPLVKNESSPELGRMRENNESSTIMVSFNSGEELPSILEKNEVIKKSSKSIPAKMTPGKKVWSCGKCATCMAEDCGKCIYCLDRPKFGGPFIKKQRCIKRRCLMKIKNKQNGNVTIA